MPVPITIDPSLGERLRQHRLRKGLTQLQVAEYVRANKMDVSRWERGERYPNFKYIKRLAEVLGCPVDDIVSHDSAPAERVSWG